jgi:DUF1009 family protein
VGAVPIEGGIQPLIDAMRGAVAEESARLFDVGQGMADIAGAEIAVGGFEGAEMGVVRREAIAQEGRRAC